VHWPNDRKLKNSFEKLFNVNEFIRPLAIDDGEVSRKSRLRIHDDRADVSILQFFLAYERCPNHKDDTEMK
jgi:hypothetical protein